MGYAYVISSNELKPLLLQYVILIIKLSPSPYILTQAVTPSFQKILATILIYSIVPIAHFEKKL